MDSINVFDAHNVLYQNVFLKFDNGPYPFRNSCPLFVKNCNFYEALVTMFSTKMFFWSSIMVYIALCLQELLPFVHEVMQYFAISSL